MAVNLGYYVNPNGSDARGSGSKTKPFATLEKVRQQLIGYRRIDQCLITLDSPDGSTTTFDIPQLPFDGTPFGATGKFAIVGTGVIEIVSSTAVLGGSGSALAILSGAPASDCTGYTIEVLSGAAAGDKRTIQVDDRAGNIIPCSNFTAALSAGNLVRIYKPAAKLWDTANTGFPTSGGRPLLDKFGGDVMGSVLVAQNACLVNVGIGGPLTLAFANIQRSHVFCFGVVPDANALVDVRSSTLIAGQMTYQLLFPGSFAWLGAPSGGTAWRGWGMGWNICNSGNNPLVVFGAGSASGYFVTSSIQTNNAASVIQMVGGKLTGTGIDCVIGNAGQVFVQGGSTEPTIIMAGGTNSCVRSKHEQFVWLSKCVLSGVNQLVIAYYESRVFIDTNVTGSSSADVAIDVRYGGKVYYNGAPSLTGAAGDIRLSDGTLVANATLGALGNVATATAAGYVGSGRVMRVN